MNQKIPSQSSSSEIPDDFIYCRVRTIIFDIIEIEWKKLTVKTKLSDLDFDSMNLTEFTLELENEFDIEIDEDAITENSTIGDIVNYVEVLKKLG